eukprot:1286431-Rhodomonas_salina.1
MSLHPPQQQHTPLAHSPNPHLLLPILAQFHRFPPPVLAQSGAAESSGEQAREGGCYAAADLGSRFQGLGSRV